VIQKHTKLNSFTASQALVCITTTDLACADTIELKSHS